MSEIVPTILTANFSEFIEKISLLSQITDRVGVDIIDGKFVDKETISLESLKDQEMSLKIDLHLMVKEPEEWVSRALEVLPDRVIGQVEMMNDPWAFVNQVIEGGAEAGIALDLKTPVESVSEEIYHLTDLVLILAAKAGLSAQEFDQKALEKIEKVREIVGNLVQIGVDCGLDEKTIPLCRKAGANIFYVNSGFWKAESLKKRYAELTNLLN